MPTQGRVNAVDAVKGMAIVLVVYGHVAQGVHHRGWWDSPAYTAQERFIYSFHMAAFFFVSGLFVQGSLARLGAGRFIVQRLRTVLWPYLVCAAGGAAVTLLGLNAAARTSDVLHSILIPALTGEASWFLPTLFLCLLLAVITARLPGWLRFAAALLLCLLWPSTGILIVDSAARYFVFLAAGEWTSRRIDQILSDSRINGLSGAAASFLAIAVWNLLNERDQRAVVVLLGFFGIAGLFKLAHALRDTVLEVAAQWCGRASLGIFVLHPFFQGATRIALARITASHAVLPNVLVPTVVAVIGPGLLWHYRKPLHIEFLFAFPWGEPKQHPAPKNPEDIPLATT